MSVMGKSTSRFDLNRNSIAKYDLFCKLKIRFVTVTIRF